MIAFNKALARELTPQDTTVNLVQPGSIDADMNPANGPVAEALVRHIELGRYGTGEDVAEAVAFLASPAAKYITGHAMTVDGGANA